MLSIYFGNPEEYIFNPDGYFNFNYEEDWLVTDFSKAAIADIDKSIVLGPNCIESPILGQIPPEKLSGGVKTVILVLYEEDKIFNATWCGDNCAKWLARIGKKYDRTIKLDYLMDFSDDDLKNGLKILNTGEIVYNRLDYISAVLEII